MVVEFCHQQRLRVANMCLQKQPVQRVTWFPPGATIERGWCKDLCIFPRRDFCHVRDVKADHAAFTSGSNHALVLVILTFDFALDRKMLTKRSKRKPNRDNVATSDRVPKTEKEVAEETQTAWKTYLEDNQDSMVDWDMAKTCLRRGIFNLKRSLDKKTVELQVAHGSPEYAKE